MRSQAPLDIETVSRIPFRGGSCLGTSRANPTKDPQSLQASVTALEQLGSLRVVPPVAPAPAG